MEKHIWRASFASFPVYGCPRCKNGSLRPKKETLQKGEPMFVFYGEHQPHPYERDERFTVFLVCDKAICGQMVCASGYIDAEPYYDNEGNEEWGDVYRPKSMIPSPHVIKVPKGLKNDTAKHLLKSFELMWMDEGAAANKLRVFIEHLLDDFQVPRKAKPSDDREIALAARIEEFEKMVQGHRTLFDALRWIGNHASHTGISSRDTLLKCYGIVDALLDELIGDKKELLDFAKKAIAAKGKI